MHGEEGVAVELVDASGNSDGHEKRLVATHTISHGCDIGDTREDCNLVDGTGSDILLGVQDATHVLLTGDLLGIEVMKLVNR